MLPLTQILVPVDRTESSRQAFELAAFLAQLHGASLVVLYVVPLPTVMYGPAPEDYLGHMHDELAEFKPDDPRIHVEYRVAEGAPALAILNVARESHCELIVMGTHGRKGLNRLLAGSVAEDVLRGAPCPVMTVKI